MSRKPSPSDLPQVHLDYLEKQDWHLPMKSQENKIIVLGAAPSLIDEISKFFSVSGGSKRLTVTRGRNHNIGADPSLLMQQQAYVVRESCDSFVLEPIVKGSGFNSIEQVLNPNTNARVITSAQHFASDLLSVISTFPYSPLLRLSGESGAGKSHLARLLHRIQRDTTLPPRTVQGMCMSHARIAIDDVVTRRMYSSGRWSAQELLEMTLGNNLKHLIVDDPQLLPRWVLKAICDAANEPPAITVTFCVTPSHNDTWVADALLNNVMSYCPTIAVPPLRARSADVPALFLDLCLEMQHTMRRAVVSIDGTWLEELKHYQWPGNVRELKELARRFVLLAPKSGFRRHEFHTL